MDDTLSSGIVDRSKWLPWVILFVGVVSASVSAILIRYADQADPLAIAFWRCVGGTVALAPFARRGFSRLNRVGWTMPLIAGFFLALHFGTWITSLELTTVAASVLLVSTTPVFVGAAAWLLFREHLKASAWIGILLSFGGAAAISGGDLSGSSLTGDLLALIGGATAGGYVLAGQIARRDLGIIEYAVVTYAAAGVLLLVACLVAGTPLWGYGAQTWWAIAAMIVGPQLLGHTFINFVLRQIDATTVSATVMLEPLIAIWLAFTLFGEVPSALIYPGGIAILIGIYLVSAARRTAPEIIE